MSKIDNPNGGFDTACDWCGKKHMHDDPNARNMDLCALCVQNVTVNYKRLANENCELHRQIEFLTQEVVRLRGMVPQ